MSEVISIRFRGGVKEYYFNPRGLRVEAGQYVIVDTAQGLEYALCVEGNHEVEKPPTALRPVVRVATENDRRTYEYNRSREREAFEIGQRKILAHGLEMKLVRVRINFDGSKIVFFFTADGRVDFRALVRDLAGVFRARIELRQIGVRDEAKMIGGIGICGRPFCCAQFLNDFIPVSIKMAKTQNLSLNPTKISGSCGRLMCCLKYEQDAYEDAARRCPRMESFVQTPDGLGNVSGVDLLREQVSVRLDSAPESPRRYHNCEVCVLRSGKGPRDGIAIPSEPPARYEPPEEPIPDYRDRLSYLGVGVDGARPGRPERGGSDAPRPEGASQRRRSRKKGGDRREDGREAAPAGEQKRGRNRRGGRSRRPGGRPRSE